MFKKAFAIAALAAIALFAGPVAANAAGYVPSNNVAVSGSSAPGGTAVVSFAAGSFAAGESVSFSVTGQGPITLSVVKAAVATATMTKTASSTGSVAVNVKLPVNASGSYTVTAAGLTSGTIGQATITVRAADAGSGSRLPFTGANVSPLIIWGAGGLLFLGIALLAVLGIVRRQRATV